MLLKISKNFKFELVREYLVGYRQHKDSASKMHLEMAGAVLTVVQKHASDTAIPSELRKVASQ